VGRQVDRFQGSGRSGLECPQPPLERPGQARDEAPHPWGAPVTLSYRHHT